MTQIAETAAKFFDTCETGGGWTACRVYCHPDATFSAQSGALADVESLEGYTEWAKGLFGPMPDANCELRSLGVDPERGHVTAYAVFRGTHTGEGGPVPPSGRGVESDYVYVMDFDGGKIRHMTKIWNDVIALQQLGWM